MPTEAAPTLRGMSTAQFPAESAPPPAHTDDGPHLRILGPVLIVFASFALSLMVFGLLKAFSVSDDSAGAIASFTGSAAILGFGLLARARLAAHERRQITSPRWSIPAAVGVGIGLGIAARIAIGVVVSVGQSVDPGICRKLIELLPHTDKSRRATNDGDTAAALFTGHRHRKLKYDVLVDIG